MAPTTESSGDAASKKPARKLRSACDSCHTTKVRCTGGTPCQTCASLDITCIYSVSNRTGRPRGTKNKKTIERLNRERALSEANKIEAEKAAAYPAFGNPIPQPMPIPGSGLHQAFMPSHGNTMAMDMTGHMPHMGSLPAMPLSTDAPSMLDLGMSWTHIPEQPHTGWLSEDITVGNAHISQSPITDIFDITSPGGMTVMPSTCPPQSFYLTPSSSRRGTQSRPSPEFQQPNGQPLQQASPPNSVGDANSTSSPPTRNGFGSGTAPILPCICLQSQADVLCSFQELNSEPHPRIDVLLKYAKKGIHAWKSTLQCDACRRGTDQESMSLCILSIRIFIRGMQRMDLGTLHADQSDANQALAAAAAAAGRVRGGSMDSSLGGFGGASMSRVASNQSQSTDVDADGLAGARMGTYEMTGADQAIVTQVLLCRALARIKEILAGLRQRLEIRQSQVGIVGGGPDQHHYQPYQRQQHRHTGQRRDSFSMSDIDECLDDNRHAQDYWAEGGHGDAEVSAHLLGSLKSLERAVQGFGRRLKDWVAASQNPS